MAKNREKNRKERARSSKDLAAWHLLILKFLIRGALVLALAIGVFLPLGMWMGYLSIYKQRQKITQVAQTAIITPRAKPAGFQMDLGHLLTLSPGQLEGTDIAAMNLACSAGLPGADDLNSGLALNTLDQWAAHVKEETERNYHRYQDNPAQFHGSESWWRAAMMITVLQQDFGVHYNLERMRDMSMTHAEDVFIPGLLNDLREGTCSSMPVLYVAIGRRLGYPLHLVATRGHYFVRWESGDGKVRFNLEGSGQGLSCHSDDFYRVWPYTLSEEDQKSGLFLRNLTSAEELAAFLSLRGNVLDAIPGREAEADLAYAEAHALEPNNIEHFGWLVLAAGREDMQLHGLLSPNDPRNPYRYKVPPPYSMLPPDSVAQQVVLHDETAK